ncbi:MAG: flagellar biosynthetic protein FliO [Pseudomonadota bacterium]
MTPADFARIVFALSSVILMLSAGAYLMQRMGLAQNARGRRKKRLKLVETLQLDPKRRAALIRCDGEEHLVILNASSTTVVARNTVRAVRQTRSSSPAAKRPAPSVALSMNAISNPFAQRTNNPPSLPSTEETAPEESATFGDAFADMESARAADDQAPPTPNQENRRPEAPAQSNTKGAYPQSALLKAREAFLAAYRKVA